MSDTTAAPPPQGLEHGTTLDEGAGAPGAPGGTGLAGELPGAARPPADTGMTGAAVGWRGRGVHARRPRAPGRRRGRVVLPSVMAGAGLALSLPPWGFWVLAFPSAALLWWRLDGLSLRARVLAGWSAGLGMFVPGLWFALGFNVYGGLVLMVVEALALALACALVPRAGGGRALALTGAMVLAEALRARWPFGGLPLGGVALGQATGPLAGSARLGGPLLIVGLVWLAGAAVGTGATPLARRAWLAARPRLARRQRTGHADTPSARTASARPLLRPVVGAAVTLAAVGGLAVWGAAAPDGGPPVGTVRAAAVQGGGVRGLRKSQVDPAVVYAAQVQATDAMAAHHAGQPPALVVWPEDVVSLGGPLDGTSTEADLGAIAAHLRATLLVGVTETVSSTQFRNEVVAFGPDGRLVARYEKVHRVPFGEYVPFRRFFSHFADLSEVPLDAVPGHGDGLLRTPAGPIGTMVSYEVFYAQRGRAPTRAGAQLLVDPTNTSSYRTSQVPTQEIAAARLQAIAQGRDLIQAAPTGFSAVIDHRGRLVARTPLSVRAVLVSDVALRSGRTLYERGGDVPVIVAAAILVIVGWLAALASDVDPVRTRAARRERAARAARARSPRRRTGTQMHAPDGQPDGPPNQAAT